MELKKKIYMLICKISFNKKKIIEIKCFFHKFFLLLNKNIRLPSQRLFNNFILLNKVFILKLNFKQKVVPKSCTFINMKEISQRPVAIFY